MKMLNVQMPMYIFNLSKMGIFTGRQSVEKADVIIQNSVSPITEYITWEII